jgi:hypothetical protein
MPNEDNSEHNDLVKAMTAPFDEEYADMPLTPTNPEDEEMKTILESPASCTDF